MLYQPSVPITTLLSFPYNTEGPRKEGIKFESFWMEDAEYEGIVQEAWHIIGQPNAGWVAKMKATSDALEKWSKKCFPNAFRQIEALKSQVSWFISLIAVPLQQTEGKERQLLTKLRNYGDRKRCIKVSSPGSTG